MKPRTETEAVAAGRKAVGGGKRWSGMWVNLGKGGCEIEKWRSFSHLETALTHLFPHKSTQVVDFPHLAMVRLFWEGAEDSRMSGRGMIGRGMGPSGRLK